MAIYNPISDYLAKVEVILTKRDYCYFSLKRMIFIKK